MLSNIGLQIDFPWVLSNLKGDVRGSRTPVREQPQYSGGKVGESSVKKIDNRSGYIHSR